MGVDYRVFYGIGVKLKTIDFDEPDQVPTHAKGYDNMREYCDAIEDDNYRCFCTGDDIADEEPLEWFIVLRKPFDGDIRDNMRLLLIHLKRMQVQYEGEVDLVGGIYIS